jgi:hypothetical protein
MSFRVLAPNNSEKSASELDIKPLASYDADIETNDAHSFTGENEMINRKKERRIYWNCHQRNHKCKGTAITEGFFIVRKGGEHNHQAYPPPRNRYTENC